MARFRLLLIFLAAWLLGTAIFFTGAATRILPTPADTDLWRFVFGTLCYGFFFALIVVFVAERCFRERRFPWTMFIGMLFGACLGAAIGFIIVQELFGSVWVGFGGVLACGWLMNRRRLPDQNTGAHNVP